MRVVLRVVPVAESNSDITTFAKGMSPLSSLLVSSFTLPEIDPKGSTLGDDVTLGAPLTLGNWLGDEVRVGTLDEDGALDGGTNPGGLV